MPELPEVETVVRGLREILVGETISRVRVNAPQSSILVSSTLGSHSFATLLRNLKILSIERRGKNILIHLSEDLTLWVHLKMTGRFRHQSSELPRHKHDLVIIDLESTAKTGLHIRFNDYRRFGRLRLFRNDELWQQKGLRELGPEPLELSANDFALLCRRRPRMLKPALLDQSFIAGIGNIYADESLHLARLHPRRLTTTLSERKVADLHCHIQQVLLMAIENMGSSVDTYTGVDGQAGRYQSYLRVYGREGENCRLCGRDIVREKIGSRSAHFCPHCQRL